MRKIGAVVNRPGYDAHVLAHSIVKRRRQDADDDALLLTHAPAATTRAPPDDFECDLTALCDGVAEMVPCTVTRFLTKNPQRCTPGWNPSVPRHVLSLRVEAAFDTEIKTAWEEWDVDGTRENVLVVDGFPKWVDRAAKLAAIEECCRTISWALWPVESKATVGGLRAAGTQ